MHETTMSMNFKYIWKKLLEKTQFRANAIKGQTELFLIKKWLEYLENIDK